MSWEGMALRCLCPEQTLASRAIMIRSVQISILRTSTCLLQKGGAQQGAFSGTAAEDWEGRVAQFIGKERTGRIHAPLAGFRKSRNGRLEA